MSRTKAVVNIKQKYMTTSECAKYLGLGEEGVRNMVYRGTLPVHKFGSDKKLRWFFDIAEMDEMLKSNVIRKELK